MKQFCNGIIASVFTFSVVLSAQDKTVTTMPPCLVVAHYGTEGSFFYRDQYGVKVEQLQPAYNGDELKAVIKAGTKVVVYDVKEHESFAEARESCFLPLPPSNGTR